MKTPRAPTKPNTRKPLGEVSLGRFRLLNLTVCLATNLPRDEPIGRISDPKRASMLKALFEFMFDSTLLCRVKKHEGVRVTVRM
jgi:hypothetical protein